MKKLLIVLVGLCLVVPAVYAAGDVREVSSKAWLKHVADMGDLRAQIFSLMVKIDPSDSDRAELAKLWRTFNLKKLAWDNYLVRISQGAKSSCEAEHAKKCEHRKCHKGFERSHKCEHGKKHICTKKHKKARLQKAHKKCCKRAKIKHCGKKHHCCCCKCCKHAKRHTCTGHHHGEHKK